MKHLLMGAALGSALISTPCAAPALAQAPTVLLSPGDAISTGELIRTIDAFEVDRNGGWIARVSFFRNGGGIGVAAISSDGDEMYSGGPVPGISGATVSSIGSVVRTDDGLTFCSMSVRLATGAFLRIIHAGFTAPLLDEDDVVSGAGLAAGSRITAYDDLETNRQGDLLIVGLVDEPLHTPSPYRAIVHLDLVGSAIASVSLLVDGSDVPPGQQGPINVFWTGEDNTVLGDNGAVLWSGSALPSPGRGVAYDLNGALLAEEGAPSPVAGRNWGPFFVPGLDVNASGNVLLNGPLDGPPATDRVFVRDGLPVLQEGDPVASVPGATYRILDSIAHLTDSGEIIHWARLAGVASSQDTVIMANDEVLVRETLSVTATGQVIDDINGETRASGNGRWILFRGWLAGDQASRLMRLERSPGLGSAYCSAEPNSTGAAAITRAFGSLLVGDQDFQLTAEPLPANTFGYFLASQTAGDVLFPSGSEGRLCLGGSVARFVSQAQNSGAGGVMAIDVDLASIPLSPAVAIASGETWRFQSWFRDFGTPPTSNFSLPVAVVFE